MHQVVEGGVPGVLDHRGRVLDLLRRRAVADHGKDPVERGLGHLVELAVERGGVRLDGEGPQHLTGVPAEGSAELDGDRVPALHRTEGRVLGRVGAPRGGHRGDAEVVDVRGPAVGDVGALHEVPELPLGQAAAQPAGECGDPGVRQRRTDPQPRHLLRAFDLTESDVVGVQGHQLGAARFQRASEAVPVRAEQAEGSAPVRPPVELCEHGRRGRGSDPPHVGVGRELPRLRHVVVEADVERVDVLGVHHCVRLTGDRPPGDPLDGRAAAVLAAHQHALDPPGGGRLEKGRASPPHLGLAEPREPVDEQARRDQRRTGVLRHATTLQTIATVMSSTMARRRSR